MAQIKQLKDATGNFYPVTHKDAIVGIEDIQVDMTGYATEQWVKDLNYLTEHQDISGKVDVVDFEEATKVTSATLNFFHSNTLWQTEDTHVKCDKSKTLEEALSGLSDIVYFTTDSHQIVLNGAIYNLLDLENYATKQWVEDKEYLTEHLDISGKVDVLEYNNKIEELETIISGLELNEYLTNVLYTDLKTLVDTGALVPGILYRIVDYVTLTKVSDAYASAGHLFDIIVTADSNTTLNENARAIQHEGDTYFVNSNLSAWKLKYSLDNNIEIFDWVDDNCKGVIYEMIDEFDNNLPYDFKNIQFKRYSTTGYIEGLVGFEGSDSWTGLTSTADNKYLYTFSMDTSNGVVDTSLNIYSNSNNRLNVNNNHYLEYIVDNKQYLNNIVHVCQENLEEGFICEGIINTKTGVNCYNISLKDKCSYWTLHNNCHDIIMNMGCNGWSCEDDCYQLLIGQNCSSWKLGHNCYNIKTGDVCIEWVCGDDCSGWRVGSNNSNWSCDSDCTNWETGPNCNYWTCGNKCHSWKTGSDCSYWTCGNNSHSWEVSESNSYWSCGNAAYYWKVENNCRNFNVCNGVHGTSTTDKLLLNFPAYTELTKQQQINASFNEYDMLTIWNPASPINYPIINRTDTGSSASECIYLEPNVYNIWIDNKLPKYVTLTLPKTDMVGEYILRFTIPSTVTNHSLVFSNEIKWVNNDVPTWDAGHTYEISIIDGYATFLKYSL